MVEISIVNMRLTGVNKNYYANKIKQFGELATKKVSYIEVGKQDTRGNWTIAFYNENNCIDLQRHFETKDGMLGFIEGFVIAKTYKDSHSGLMQ